MDREADFSAKKDSLKRIFFGGEFEFRIFFGEEGVGHFSYERGYFDSLVEFLVTLLIDCLCIDSFKNGISDQSRENFSFSGSKIAENCDFLAVKNILKFLTGLVCFLGPKF